jgi:SWI/SNF-related matrix-associated actin-dependent regulator 1 of chromatin subfamily A
MCVDVLEDQGVAYKEAVEEYRALAMAARAARAAKASKALSSNISDVLPRRQVSNIFTQLRKLANHPLLIRRIFTDETVKQLAKKFHQLQVFGNECTVERVRDELMSYSDFSLHKVCFSEESCPSLAYCIVYPEVCIPCPTNCSQQFGNSSWRCNWLHTSLV